MISFHDIYSNSKELLMIVTITLADTLFIHLPIQFTATYTAEKLELGNPVSHKCSVVVVFFSEKQ